MAERCCVRRRGPHRDTRPRQYWRRHARSTNIPNQQAQPRHKENVMSRPARRADTGRQARRTGRISLRLRHRGEDHGRPRLFDRARALRGRRPHDRRPDAHDCGNRRRSRHSHPNEQWIYVLEGTFRATIGGKQIDATPGSVVYIPANTLHAGKATADGDVVFFTVKDDSHSLHESKPPNNRGTETIEKLPPHFMEDTDETPEPNPAVRHLPGLRHRNRFRARQISEPVGQGHRALCAGWRHRHHRAHCRR